MKLLRDFFRLRVARSGRRSDSRSWTITVPAPLSQAQDATSSEAHRLSDAPRGHQLARRKEPAAPQAHRHLQLVSSH
jgi:hypothetical protein